MPPAQLIPCNLFARASPPRRRHRARDGRSPRTAREPASRKHTVRGDAAALITNHRSRPAHPDECVAPSRVAPRSRRPSAGIEARAPPRRRRPRRCRSSMAPSPCKSGTLRELNIAPRVLAVEVWTAWPLPMPPARRILKVVGTVQGWGGR